MLKSLELENFKAFGERAKIEFAPITLVFGENSAGKSSILQSLSLLKQTRESREHGAVLLPRSDSGTVDLGTFQELLFDHDQDRELCIRLVVEQPNDKKDELWHFRHMFFDTPKDVPRTTGLELGFRWPPNEKEVSLHRFVVSSEDQGDVGRFTPVQLKKNETRRLSGPFFFFPRHQRGPSNTQLRAAACTWVTTSPAVWRPYFKRAHDNREKIVKSLDKLRSEMDSTQFFESEFPFIEGADEKAALAQAIFTAGEFYSSAFSEAQFIERVSAGEHNSLVMLDGFIPAGPAGIRQAGRLSILPENLATRRHGRLRGLSLDMAVRATYAGQLIEQTLETLFPMGPFRRPPERWYIFTGAKPQDVGYKGELLPDLLYRSPELVRDANKWLERLKIGYELDVRPVGSGSSDLFEVRLRDLRRNGKVDVALSDVGFGISQLLPFLVQSLATERQTISIEQPEVHIHPRLQAEIGDLLAEAIKKPRCHRFIIETHSEHLILRLQRLIRKGTLSPKDVSVVYVSRGANGAKVERLELGEDGEFKDDWPGGFFPERVRELT